MDNTGLSRSPYNGAPKTASFGGDRLAASIEFTSQGGASTQMERAALISFLARLRGRQNRAYLFDHANRIRGSFPAAELLTNNTFASGTTGWTAFNATASLSASNRVLRSTIISGPGAPLFHQQLTGLTQYAPYVGRAMLAPGSGSPWSAEVSIGLTGGASTYAQTISVAPTSVLVTATGVVSVTNPFFAAGDGTGAQNGRIAGNYIECPFTSFSRCALVDNGGNSLLRSDEFATTWSAVRATVSSNFLAAPDGNTTGDALVEDATASQSHFVGQAVTVSAAAGEYSFACALRAGTRTWAYLQLEESTGNHTASAYFNLSTGAAGTVSVSGANWTVQRSFVADMGGGWFYCCIVARKGSAGTTLTARVALSTADNTPTYSGDGASYISAWRATLRASSLPTRLVQSTSASVSDTGQTGSALHLKGLPASTSGLLLPNDQFEVITSRGSELKIVTAALNSDAACLGYLQFEPPMRGTPADNAPIIIHQPMMRGIFNGEFPEWPNEPGVITTASAEFEEV